MPTIKTSRIKVKTFTGALMPMQTMKALEMLDNQVNSFIQENNVAKVMSVSDTCTSGGGETIGIIRVLVYEEG
jgi:spore coat polysaccharide biosynthesis predicted glycosyltransferase SpsG